MPASLAYPCSPVNPLSPVVSGRPRTPAARLAQANIGLIGFVFTHRFLRLLEDDDRRADAYTYAYLALLDAAARYDPARGKFAMLTCWLPTFTCPAF